MKNYQFIDKDVLAIIDEDGASRGSCSIFNEQYLEWLAQGNTPLPDPDAPKKAIAEQNAPLLAQMQALESQCTERRWREALLSASGAVTFMQTIDDKIKTLRGQLIK